jgi:leucyl aminopeptidase
MTPTIMAETVVEAVKGTGIKATIWDGARIKKEKMGGLFGVSQGSDQDPRFIILEYKGAAASKKPIAFVGKGLTFDCGGISIKPSAGMEDMKYDMCGGANVIGATLAIAKLKLKVNLICLVPATENLVNGSATKPGDVHFARNGKSFEVNNTDAEGRLILADALCYATEQQPQVIIDAATLTGAMLVALGNIHTGYFTRNQALKKKIEAAAAESGEWVWNMPLTDHHVKDMKGTYADLSNMSAGKGAGSGTAAAFLEQFVGEGIPWAHFDIAGTAWSTGGRLPYTPKKGASGVMIRTFVELAKQY